MNNTSGEIYTPGYVPNASNFMANRRAATHAAFFLPYLKPGMNVLDCGCGPGTITVGLAQAVNPGHVSGIDLAESQIELARAQAARLTNVDFRVGNIYDLPFEAAAFDAVFAHAVMEHLKTPLNAFKEIRRVLKSGGVAGVCSPDWGGFLISPSNPTLEAAIRFYKQLQINNGGDPYAGRQLGTYAHEAGFSQIELTAYYECYENLETIAEYLALRIENATAEECAKITWSDMPGMAEMIEAMRVLGHQSPGLFAQSWVAVIGRAV